MATQFSDPALGGTSGFASQYTPIQFAPLVSLTGPIQGPATPTATAPAAPTAQPLRLPMMGGMAEMPDNAYMTGQAGAYPEGMPPIGERSSQQIMGDLARIGEFFMSPLSTMASYAATGKTPSEHMSGVSGGSPSGGNPFAGFLQGLQGLLGGGQQRAAEVPIGPQMLSERAQGGVASIGGIGGAAYNDAVSIALGGGATQEMADAAGRNAAGLVAQGMDPASAVALAAMTAMGQVGPEMPGGMPAPGGAQAPSPGILGGSPVANQVLSDIYGVMQFAPGGMQSGPGGASLGEEGSSGYGGGTAGETGAPGESSYGLDR